MSLGFKSIHRFIATVLYIASSLDSIESILSYVRDRSRPLQHCFILLKDCISVWVLFWAIKSISLLLLFINTREIISTNIPKNYYKKKYPNILRYKNQLIHMIAVWEPEEEK